MQDAEILVYNALAADTTLLTLLGGKVVVSEEEVWNRIYNSQIAPNADEYPRMTMFEVVNDDADSGDDEPQSSDVNIRIDVWVKDEASLFAICKQVKKGLKSAFPTCTIRLESKIYDDGVHHKPINVYLLLEQGDD